MTIAIDETHSSSLRSWIETANYPHSDFPIQNLPFGVFRRQGSVDPGRVGVALGDQIIDIAALLSAGLFDESAIEAAEACDALVLNGLMALGHEPMRALRQRLSQLYRTGAPERERAALALVPMRDCELLLPAAIGDYSDFFASVYHATNAGRLFRPDDPLLPNYKYIPVGYHGRASSVVASGTPVRRPHGQARAPLSDRPQFGLSRRLDYELEVGCFIGRGNALGAPIPIAEASEHIFGLCLLNDWSARDIQGWESQPLGPFLAKSFATSLSPWVVTAEALAPFRARAFQRAPGDPAPLDYLLDAADQESGAIEISLEVCIQTAAMRDANVAPHRLSRSNFRDMYWTVAQMIAHHSSNGCNLRPGDLLGSGTVSGATPDSLGCLLELTRGGAEALNLPGGETRRFLEYGDEVILRGRCEREGFVSIGFGECRGRVI